MKKFVGAVVADFAFNDGNGLSFALQPDGKILVGDGTESGLINQDFGIARYNTDGSLDLTFGTGGRVITDLGKFFANGFMPLESSEFIVGLLVQPDGKILAAGTSSYLVGANEYYDFAIVRYNVNGSLDKSFSLDGVSLPDDFRYDFSHNVSLQSDGKIYLGGVAALTASKRAFSVVKLNIDGTLDNTFGNSTGGISATWIGSADVTASFAAPQPDGKVVIFGTVNNDDAFIARYNADGKLDTTFGSSGLSIIGFSGNNLLVSDFKIQADGKIIVVGGTNLGSGYDNFIARFDSGGHLDLGFGNNGIAITSLAVGADIASAVSILADGSYLIAGRTNNGSNWDSYVLKHNQNGSLDLSFGGGDGVVVSDFGASELARFLNVDSNGKILVLGESREANSFTDNVLMIRYNSDGSVDSTFGLVGNPPVFTSSATATTPENVSTSTPVYTVAATDPDANTTLTYSISGGADASLFNINATTGAVTFKASPNYEAPADSGANNVYDIVVQASDGALRSSKSVAITVTDVVDTLPGAAYSWVGASGHTYGLYKTAMTWAAAKSFAESVGGYLAHVDSDAENTEIFNKVLAQFNTQDFTSSRASYNAGGVAYVWLGASDAAVEGTWRWANDNSVLSYAKWGSGALGAEPDNTLNQDHLALGLQNWPAGSGAGQGIGTAGQWNDIDGVNNSVYFVVEKDTAPLRSLALGGRDFNADAKGDILFQNVRDGACYVWEVNGLKIVDGGSGQIGPPVGTAWRIKATGDFNGDGKSDFLFQNVNDGACYVWGIDGLNIVGGGSGLVGPAVGTAWQIKATGDFNGDGRSDFLFQNAINGACYVWEMNGMTMVDGGAVGPAVGTDWRIKATGDFNGDGKSDFLFQNAINGACYIWEMNGLSVGDSGFVGPAAVGTDWQIKATGDFNGDGKSDLLFQNVRDGACYIWELNGLSILAGAQVGPAVGTDWQVKGTNDFNGDGRSDILFQNVRDGASYIWEMNGFTILDGAQIGPAVGTDWQVMA